MQFLPWICGFLCLGLPALMAYPMPLTNQPNQSLKTIQPSSEWEHYWIQYIIGLMSITATAFSIVGCLCCHKHRKRKGFKNTAEKYKQEFKDENRIGSKTRLSHSVALNDMSCTHFDGFEFDMPCTQSVDRIQFEPLPVERIISRNKIVNPKRLPLSMFPYEEPNSESNGIQELFHEWFDATNLHVPRERLKYLREIGHGWFGKVVEGHADLDEPKRNLKNGSVIVRILTEEATVKEKAWFLAETTMYIKLHHPNIVALLGFCLETDPYLLLFELCASGDVKGFLLSNQDKKSQDALRKENVPTRMVIDIASGLKYMHTHGFVHTDLSARNCLVTSDLSVKIGDYGTAVEKYPADYYVLSDRALPIRWSAPESIECTDSAIETREITIQANVWSYGVLLWEVFVWGKRPYDEKSDEEVIQMLLSLRGNTLLNGSQDPLDTEYCPDIDKLIQLCMHVDPTKRPILEEIKQILVNKQMGYAEFDQLEVPLPQQIIKSASLQDLRGSIDSDFWATIEEDSQQQILPSAFRLGPDEPVKNIPKVMNVTVHQESGSETEEESWRGRIEQGVYTEKVKQKSKSVTDLMVLVHIDLDSDAEVSMGTQISEKLQKKRLPSTGSDSDLRHNSHADEFNEALRKLRNPLPKNTRNKIKSFENPEQPKFLTLVSDQAQMPILRLSFDDKKFSEPSQSDESCSNSMNVESTSNKTHVLRLLTKGDPDLPLLRYVPDTLLESAGCDNDFHFGSDSGNGDSTCSPAQHCGSTITLSRDELKDNILQNEKLETPTNETLTGLPEDSECNACSEPEARIAFPNVHQPCTEYLSFMGESDISNFENLCAQRECLQTETEELEEEEERKHLFTPDDEQSSDSGFRDKESCEEEESICPSSVPVTSKNVSALSTIGHSEEEQLQVLLELDDILDAEYNATLPESKDVASDVSVANCIEDTCLLSKEENYQTSPTVVSKVENTNPDLNKNYCTKASVEDEKQPFCFTPEEDNSFCESEYQDQDLDNIESLNLHEKPIELECTSERSESIQNNECETISDSDYDIKPAQEQEHDDEDSSTVSLRSDNSYMSFGIDEEFVNAIRNELREKLPCAQMAVVEPLEDHDDDNLPIANEIDVKQWEEDENEESCNQVSGGVGISIRYNVYGTPLSPILEERESTVNSESLISRDVSITSKESSDDVLLVDTKTNKMILLEGVGHNLQEDDRDTTNEEFSEEENLDYACSLSNSYSDKSCIMIPTGGAPLPSPEDESKWQQLSTSYPLPLPVPSQDDLISTSFMTRNLWHNRGEGDEEDDDDGEEELDEDNSSSSGEFVWKRYDDSLITQEHIRNSLNSEGLTMINNNVNNEMEDEDDEQEKEDIEEEEEFTPSAWDASLAPHRSALRSPDKTLKSGDQKKSVCFKKQRYHCVYEYPKEVLVTESHPETSSEPTSYADWEQMLEEPRSEHFPLDYDIANCSGSEEFFVSSSNRPFQYTASNAKYVSQFFPGATTATPTESHDTVDSSQDLGENNVDLETDYGSRQQYQLGELRHTRDRLKLNLFSRTSTATISATTKQILEDNMNQLHDNDQSVDNVDFTQGQLTGLNIGKDDVPPNVPRKEIE